MTASLIVAGYELLGATTNPEYRLAPGFDFGQGDPDQVTIASLYLDGETVSGVRTSNRQISLPLWVSGTTPLAVAVAVDALLQAVSAETFTAQWTPDGGLPVVFDCYRAAWSRPRDLLREAQGSTALTLTFTAKPFGRSTDIQSIVGASSLQVDSFNTAPTGATLDTTTKYEGTGSAAYVLTRSGSIYSNATPISRTYAAKDLSTYGGVAFRLILNTTSGTVAATVTLGSAAGSTRYSLTQSVPSPSSWALLSFSLTGGTVVTGSGVDLSAVTSESITLSVTPLFVVGPMTTITVNVDDLRATAGSTALLSTTRGAVLLMPPTLGTARTPVNLAMTAGAAMDTVLVHSPPGDQDAGAQILSAIAVGSAPSSDTATAAAGSGEFRGTYSVVLGATNALSGTNSTTVTVTQKENGTTVATQVLSRTYTAPLDTGRIVSMGEVTLPLRATAIDNTLTSYTFAVDHTSGADAYQDVMLLDTRGQTVIAAPSTSVPTVYVDEPSPVTGVGPVLGSSAGRDRAYGILDRCLLSGGPILFEPGTNKLLTWGPAAAPSVTATYYPRWLDERVA